MNILGGEFLINPKDAGKQFSKTGLKILLTPAEFATIKTALGSKPGMRLSTVYLTRKQVKNVVTNKNGMKVLTLETLMDWKFGNWELSSAAHFLARWLKEPNRGDWTYNE